MILKSNTLTFAAGLAAGMIFSTSAASADTFGPMDTSGFVEIFGSYSDAVEDNSSGADDNYTGGGGGGRVNFWLSDSHTVQIDGNLNFFRNDPDNDTEHAVEMVVHSGWRDPERGYIGGFGGLISYGYTGSDSRDSNQWIAGGEGAVYLDMITVFAQAGFMDTFNRDEAESFEDTYFVQGGVRYFASSNLKLEASGGFLSGDEYGDTPVDIPFWRAEVEYKPEDFRVSWFAAYEGYSENEDGNEHTNHTVMGGVRIHFGQDTLLSFDRSGASQVFLNSRMLLMADDQ